MTAYLNPATPYPAIAEHAGMAEWNPFLKPVIADPSEAYRALELRSPGGPLYLETETKLAKWLATEPMYLLWPETGGFVNLGSFMTGTKATPVTTAPAILGNQFQITSAANVLNANVPTRTNYIADPIFTNLTVTKCWAPTGAGVTLERPSGELPLGLTGNYCKVNVPLETASRGIRSSTTAAFVVPIAAGERLDLGAWIKAEGAAGIRFEVIWRNAEGATIENKVLGTIESNGTWRWSAVTGTAPAATAGALVQITTTSLNKAASFSVWGLMAEKGRTTTIASSEQFPNAPQFTAGYAGWAGAENESASDLGPWARGTADTFVANVAPTTLAANIGFMGAAANNAMWASSVGKLIVRQNGVDHAVSELSKVVTGNHQYAFVFNDVTNTIAGYIDGAVQLSTSSDTDTWTPPPAFEIGRALGTSNFAPIGPVGIWPRALSAAELASLV